ncbi:acyltransferase family protein [Bifidobacterium gallicum]|uniref:ABC transporter n=1 Tax=Bifidobacterium gallicum DSM 20093 = LMG 11596 TaxID=561180 RepID=D1NVK3_9BIFI|nr:acyltransferase family protein [Bifidobacterium gallicum]EFA22854.1 acyltransferase [Bifidobacterium gallicum DSM 20093 = LMG 11596]KFI59436.1 ABC transporter [Bifidobacterium gallicum DSM 20093 = LMG 11596]
MVRTADVQHATGHKASEREQSHHFTGVDGLRAIAIIGVLLYHTRPSLLTGGLLGVTMFLVVSGFFITRSILNAVDRGTFAYVTYLKRRLRRIWPPVLGSIAFIAPLIYWCTPSLLAKVRADTLPSGLFVSNWVYIFRHDSYFAAAGLPSPLTPLWYTSLLMQFYVIWPFIMLLIWSWRTSREHRIGAIVVLIALSTLEMALMSVAGVDTSRMYYGLDTRAGELLVGALLAVVLHRRRPTTQPRSSGHRRQHATAAEAPMPTVVRTALPVLAAVGLIVMIVLFFVVHGESAGLYRGGFLLVALLSALLVYAAVRSNVVACALSIKPLRYLGSRSFSLYLVHFPLLEVMNPATRTTPIRWWEWIGQFLLIMVVAEAFYQLVEALRGTPLLPWLRSPSSAVRHAVPTPSQRASNATPSRRANTASTGTLRITSRIACALGVVTILVLLLPLHWDAIAQQRAQVLRPELAASATPSVGSSAAPSAAPSQSAAAQPKPSDQADAATAQTGHVTAEKVPFNLHTNDWQCDNAQKICQARVLVVGDSVTLGAQEAIMQHFPNAVVDAAVSRYPSSGVAAIHDHIDTGYDAQVVIVALGSNGTVVPEAIQGYLDAVQGRPLYIVLPRAPASWVDPNIALFRQWAADHDNMGLLDWQKLSGEHPEYLVDDGTHLTPSGQQAFATMLYDAVCPH